MATIAMSGPLSTRMTTNENTTESHSLSLLSSIAAIVPDDPNEKLHMQKRQDGLSSARTPIVNLNSIKGSGKRKGSGKLSSLSRSVSSKNLRQESVVTSFSPPSRKRRKQNEAQVANNRRQRKWRLFRWPTSDCEVCLRYCVRTRGGGTYW